MSIADRIRLAMQRRGWNQSDLSQRSGVGQTTISAILRGGEPKLSNADAIAAALGVDLEWLAGRSESEEASTPSPHQRAILKIANAIETKGAIWVADQIGSDAPQEPMPNDSISPVPSDPPRKARKTAKPKGDQK